MQARLLVHTSIVLGLATIGACADTFKPSSAEQITATAADHLVYDCAAQTALSEAACDVLVEFYDATGGDGWTDNTGWLTSADPCSWFGIMCWSPLGSSVRRIDLQDNNLVGEIPAGIVGLTLLEALNVPDNGLSGVIPPGLGDLEQLRFLILSGNEIGGILPPRLGDLANLQTLFLGRNQLTGAIPIEFEGLVRLENLDLGSNQLSGPVPAMLADLPVLRLRLSDNLLSGQVPLVLAEKYGRLPPGWCGAEDNLGLFMPDTPSYRAADDDMDGVICGIELGADTDGDGIPDAVDPDVIAGALDVIPDAAFKSPGAGHRNAMQSRLDDIEQDIADGDVGQAIRALENLRRKVDGCGATADMDDWIIDCAAQIEIRDLIDTMIAGLGG